MRVRIPLSAFNDRLLKIKVNGVDDMVRNKVEDLNNILFEQLERLNDDSLDLDKELKRATGISKISNNIIESMNLVYKATKLNADMTGEFKTPEMLEVKNENKTESKNN
ncbi:hypothetical protein [Ligilactobacillus salivarius]|nr:hypothetical protein [Ligilactobacillus salivarius]